MIHGIAVREKATNKLADFIKCGTGKEALTVLSGIRRNMIDDYEASEEFVDEKEIEELIDDYEASEEFVDEKEIEELE